MVTEHEDAHLEGDDSAPFDDEDREDSVLSYEALCAERDEVD